MYFISMIIIIACDTSLRMLA